MRADEHRGLLTAIDFAELPFAPRRVFTVTGCPPGTTRGRHRHRVGHQLLVCTSGEVRVQLRAGEDVRGVSCRPDGHGLLVSAGVWASQEYLTGDTTLLVLASHPYDPSSYLHDGDDGTHA